MLIFRHSAELTQFTQGMNDVCGFWELVLQNANVFKTSLCTPPAVLDRESFLSLCHSNFSEEGTSKRIGEEDTQYAWESFLLDIEGKSIWFYSILTI